MFNFFQGARKFIVLISFEYIPMPVNSTRAVIVLNVIPSRKIFVSPCIFQNQLLPTRRTLLNPQCLISTPSH